MLGELAADILYPTHGFHSWCEKILEHKIMNFSRTSPQ